MLDACGPDIYGRNAFCLLGVDADQSGRRIKRQAKELQAAIEIDDLADEYCKTLRPDPLPTREELSLAAMVLADAQQRFISEFFWFWPLEWGKSASDEALGLLKSGHVKEARKHWAQIAEDDGKASLAARHNLAVLGHWRALEREQKILASTDTGRVAGEQRQKIIGYWNFAFKHWEALCEDESFWSMQADRIRSMNDAGLTTGFLRRFSQSLPIAFDNINADLAVAYCERGMYASATDHVEIMKATNAGSDDVGASLRRVTEPLQRRVDQAIEKAVSRLRHHKAEGKQLAAGLFATVKDILNILHALLGKESPEHAGTCDHVAATIRDCMIAYGNETEDWAGCLPQLEHMAEEAFDKELQSRLRNDVTQVKTIRLQNRVSEAIETATQQLDDYKEEGKYRAIELYDTVRGFLNKLRTLLGKESPEYANTSDQVAATIRGCMIAYGNETEDWARCLSILKNAAELAFDKELKSRLQDDVTQIKDNHEEKQRVEELKKSVTADYVYDVAISPRDDGALRASVPGVCTCCLGTPNGEQVVSHEWEETRGLKRYKRSISFGFPICDACRNHQSEYASKQIALVLLAAGISIAIAFFARGMIQDLEWLPFVICGGLLTAVLLFMLSAVIRVGVLSEKHACRGRAVMVRDASGSCAIFRFHNPIYADSFAKANALAVRQHQEYKPTRGSFILVLPDAVLLVIAALVLGCIGQSIVYANRDGGKSSSGNSPRSLKSSPTQTDSPPKRLPPTNRHIRSPSPAPRTYTPPKRYVPTRIDTGLSKKIDSGKARLRSLEAEIAPMDSEIESMFAELGVCKRELEGYESRIRRGLRVDSDLYQRVRNKHNGLVKQYNALLVPRNFKFNEYQRERDAVNALVRQYNSGER